MYFKKNWNDYKLKKISAFIVLAVSILGYIWLSYNYVNKKICTVKGSYGVISILYFIACILMIVRLLKSHIYVVKKIWLNIVYMLLVSLIAVYMEELIWNQSLSELTIPVFFLNYILILVPTVAIVFIFRNASIAYASIMIVCWFYGMINHYVLEFKGCPPLYGDLCAARTGISVMGQYEFWLCDSIVFGTILFLYMFLILIFFPPFRICVQKRRNKVLISLGGVVGLVILFLGIYNVNIHSNFGLSINAWSPVISFSANGAPVTLLINVQNMKIDKPEGYSNGYAQNILKQYEDNVEMPNKELPTVIVIMNESFSDLSVLGEFESDEYLSNWKNMNSYIMRGYTYPSVCGGSTCNSEFEFLTGNSMANLDSGITPYEMFDLSKTFDIVEIFSQLEYETVAMHPYNAKNWNRDQVYQWFGFNDFIAIEDMQDVQCLSWSASDAYNYEQVIHIYESRTAPLFLFNITMQNHGGYNTALRDDIALISIEEQYKRYGDVINYLTLIRESDNAFWNLLEYFSNQDDPVVVCMFGDHQPTLDEEFIDSVISLDDPKEKERRRFMTPYIIWSNFDMQVHNRDCDMSINYLGANLLDLLGIHTEYTDYLLDLQKEIPIINQVGYQTVDGVWHELWEENDKINEYRIVQYHQLFGK